MTRDASFVATAPRPAVLLALIALAAALPFVGALGGPFIWDDTHLIENNPRVHTLARVHQLFTHSYFDTGTGSSTHFVPYYRPISLLSYATDWAIGNGNPAVFHATNLLLAMVVTWLAADCLLRWTRCTSMALLGALLFAWHPSKAESVAWISGRTDLLAGAFMLLACKAHSHMGRRAWAAVELMATLAAYASKETAILLPILISIEHWATFDRAPLAAAQLHSLVRSTRLHWAGALAYLAVRSLVFPLLTDHRSVVDSPLTNRLGLAFESLGRAAHVLFYPYRQSAEHGLVSIDARGLPILHGPHVALGVTFGLALCGCAWLTRRRAPAIALGCATVLLTLLPTANLIPTQLQSVFYERFLFLPTLGLALLLVAVMQALLVRRTAWRVCAVTIVVVLASFALRSNARASDYASTVGFWSHEVAANPLSTTAPQALANSARTTGDVSQAVRYLSQCHANAVARRQQRTAIRCAYDAAALAADATADLNQPSLQSARRFFAAFAKMDDSRYAQLDLDGMSVKIDTSTPEVARLARELSGESFAILSWIELRLSAPEALEHARLALTECQTCPYSLRAVRVLAATGHVDQGLKIADGMRREGSAYPIAQVQTQLRQVAFWLNRASDTRGPEQLHAKAQGYLVLGLYGAAYAILSPHSQEFRAVPAMNLQYAQVAYYAGDATTARQTLLDMLDPQATERLLSSWGKGQSTPF